MPTRLLALLLVAPLLAQDLSWPMKGHDARRTGRASVPGPRKGNSVWRYVAQDGVVINMEPTVTREGVFFGTWGCIRRHGATEADFDKCDGKVYGLGLDGRPLWEPLLPARTPWAYKLTSRPHEAQDNKLPEGFHLDYFNGTVEGTPTVDPSNGRLYVGRGDGAVYCIDPAGGKVVWRFQTLDPAVPDDPEGGGEVVGGPVITKDGLILFGTFGCPAGADPPKKIRHETNALYAITREGKLAWRVPAKGSEANGYVAAMALSPDGQIAYAAGHLADPRSPSQIVALEAATGKEVWRQKLAGYGGQDLAVGCDGVVYVAGMKVKCLGLYPVAFALDGATGKPLWGPVAVDGEKTETHFAGGIALFEEGGVVRGVYVSTTSLRERNGKEGRLHRLDPKSGAVAASWDPAKATPPCVGGLTDVTLDSDGVVYVGVRGHAPWFSAKESRGRVYALRPNFEVAWSFEVDHQLDWASPAIGPDGGLYFGTSDTLGVGHILARGESEDIKEADPVLYGIHDK